jgi:hypothetical protein
MIDPEWLHCVDPQKMLSRIGPTASARKLRWFAVACCHQVWPLLTSSRSRNAVAMLEQLLDGPTDPAAFTLPEQLAASELSNPGKPISVHNAYAVHAVLAVCDADALQAARRAAHAAADAVKHFAKESARRQGEGPARVPGSISPGAAARRSQCDWLRDIFAPPGLPLADVSAWSESRNGLVSRMARAAYLDRTFMDLPVLADALEDAGCADTEILAHLRGPGVHVRGCWAVDLLLGRS